MERRVFLKNSSILAGGLLAANKLNAVNLEVPPIRIAIIGCGDRGKGIIHILNKMPDKYRIIAVCDVLDFRLESAKKISGSASWKTYKDYGQMLSSEKLDAVVIAVPLYLHYPIAVETIKSGCHLYLEKTMTYDIQQSINLVGLMRGRKRQILQVGHQYRYSPLYYRVKEMIEKGSLGKITQVDCRWDRNGSWRREVPNKNLERAVNWRMYKAYSGGLVAELLSHQIDFINWLFDTHPDEFFATGGIDVYKDGRETYDNVQVMLRYSKIGLIGNFGSMCGNARDGYLFKIKGTLGTVSLLIDQGMFYPEKKTQPSKEIIDGVTGASKIGWDKDGGFPILLQKPLDGTVYAFEDFHKRILDGSTPDSNVLTGARTAISVHLANEALYTKKKILWNKDFDV
ncbi:gfo/Idh/MocA family oxidoreductase [Pedobacter petrophilus]|uniref:Gfo/Idh/MocA family oxidoreductase n=2 Tax=Pedobacter TaxID=84567 RepID=A0A7K0G3B5_9SPHI|nr:Gfo/Idh/MocA family oxidoreductase [Pedobacter petrophilus]MRX78307.1 gfo/Idh/MocA family oxidoreductase [Pedobacter petrophilus]